ncbi:unnamed protein product [Effrenium voratum]|uniref:Uncharacterized protein n=1 Tax=Effrenium voratum TaxID=2562239 RepID=A0AA36NA45_9DINO|nr:unnamed protein product [Effrenium voratum]
MAEVLVVHVLMPIASHVPEILWQLRDQAVGPSPIPELLPYVDVIMQRLRTKLGRLQLQDAKQALSHEDEYEEPPELSPRGVGRRRASDLGPVNVETTPNLPTELLRVAMTRRFSEASLCSDLPPLSELWGGERSQDGTWPRALEEAEARCRRLLAALGQDFFSGIHFVPRFQRLIEMPFEHYHFWEQVLESESEELMAQWKASSMALGTVAYGLLGDSSLYLKRGNGKKSQIKGDLEYELQQTLVLQYSSGGGVKEFLRMLRSGYRYEVLGISYFGNEHTLLPLDPEEHFPWWLQLFEELRLRCERVIFFMGGVSTKYGYSNFYDESLAAIRCWITGAGFAVRTDFDQVLSWPLASDGLHFSADAKAQIVAYFRDLLLQAPAIAEPQLAYEPLEDLPAAECASQSAAEDVEEEAAVKARAKRWQRRTEPCEAEMEIVWPDLLSLRLPDDGSADVADAVVASFVSGAYREIIAALVDMREGALCDVSCSLSPDGRWVLCRELAKKCLEEDDDDALERFELLMEHRLPGFVELVHRAVRRRWKQEVPPLPSCAVLVCGRLRCRDGDAQCNAVQRVLRICEFGFSAADFAPASVSRDGAAGIRYRSESFRSATFMLLDPDEIDCPISYISPGLEDLMGYWRAWALGRHFRFLLLPDALPNRVFNGTESARIEDFCYNQGKDQPLGAPEPASHLLSLLQLHSDAPLWCCLYLRHVWLQDPAVDHKIDFSVKHFIFVAVLPLHTQMPALQDLLQDALETNLQLTARLRQLLLEKTPPNVALTEKQAVSILDTVIPAWLLESGRGVPSCMVGHHFVPRLGLAALRDFRGLWPRIDTTAAQEVPENLVVAADRLVDVSSYFNGGKVWRQRSRSYRCCKSHANELGVIKSEQDPNASVLPGCKGLAGMSFKSFVHYSLPKCVVAKSGLPLSLASLNFPQTQLVGTLVDVSDVLLRGRNRIRLPSGQVWRCCTAKGGKHSFLVEQKGNIMDDTPFEALQNHFGVFSNNKCGGLMGYGYHSWNKWPGNRCLVLSSDVPLEAQNLLGWTKTAELTTQQPAHVAATTRTPSSTTGETAEAAESSPESAEVPQPPKPEVILEPAAVVPKPVVKNSAPIIPSTTVPTLYQESITDADNTLDFEVETETSTKAPSSTWKLAVRIVDATSASTVGSAKLQLLKADRSLLFEADTTEVGVATFHVPKTEEVVIIDSSKTSGYSPMTRKYKWKSSCRGRDECLTQCALSPTFR